MGDFISKFWLTGICLVIIAVWAFGANKKFKAAVDKNPYGDYEQPQTASILGVLGTFLGISIGLLNFNPTPDAMHQSVINLLGGMTTAFFTSIVGMGISLYFKNYQADAQKNFHGVNKESNLEDLIEYLKKSDAEKLALIKKLITSIVGEEDSTVTGQIKMFKSDLHDEFKNLKKTLNDNNENIVNELNNFGKTLAESNTKAFIDALNDTMKDFNQKLTEQFGENFKQLNIAVGRLLEWQENYKFIIKTVTQNLQVAIEGINAVTISVEQIEKSAGSMTESSKQIQNLIVTANFYEQKLEQVLKEVQTLGEISKSAVPNMLAFLRNSCDEIQNYTELATQNTNSHVNAVVDNLEEKVNITINQTNIMTRQFMNNGNSALNKITETTNQNIILMQKLSEELRNESFKIITETNTKMNQMMTTNDTNLKKSLETLGTAMLKISDKFVEDYTPLVTELKKIVEIAKFVR